MKVTYDDHVQPIFREKCFTCHNPDKKSSGLDVTTYSALMQGGSSGEVIAPGDLGGSYLYQLVTHESEPFMPPKSDKMPEETLNVIKAWIEGGALQNAGSKPVASKKPKVQLALTDTPTNRPAEVPLPGHLELEPTVTTAVSGAVTAMATSPWAPLVAIAGQKQVLLYNTQTLDFLGALPFAEGTPYVLRFSRNGSLLLAGGGRGGASGRVVVWDIKTGQRVFEVGDELDAVLAADISADQKLIALGGPQKVVRVYATADGKLLYEARKHTDWIMSLEFSPDGVLLATGDRAGNMFVWESVTGREYLSLKGHTASITAISWRMDSNIVASCSEDTTVRLWELENGGQVRGWGANGGGSTSLEFARDGRLVTNGRDQVARLWNQEGQQQVAYEAFGDIGVACTFCDETNRVLAGDWSGNIRVWEAADGKGVGTLVANPPSLATRLQTAQQTLATKQAEAQPLMTAATVAAETLGKIRADVVTTEQAIATMTADRQAAQVAVEQLAAQIPQLEAQLQTAGTRKAMLDGLVPKLQQSAASAKEAAALDPADQSLAQLAATSAALADERTKELAAVDQGIVQTQGTLEQSRKDLAQKTELVVQLDAQLQTQKAQLETLVAAVKPAEDQSNAAQAALTAAQQAIATAEQEIQRWQSEIEFVNKMKQLREQQAAAEQKVNQQQAQVDQLAAALEAAAKKVQESNAALEPIRAAATKAQQDQAAAKSAADQAIAAKQTADTQVTTGITQIDNLQAAIAALQEAAAKTKEAAAKTGDSELQQTADAITALATKKQEELGAAQTAQQAAVALAQQAAQTADAANQALTVKSEAARVAAEQLAVADAQHQPLVAAAEMAKQALEQAQAQINDLQKQLELVATEIAAARVKT